MYAPRTPLTRDTSVPVPHHHRSTLRHVERPYDLSGGLHGPPALFYEASLNYRLDPFRPPHIANRAVYVRDRSSGGGTVAVAPAPTAAPASATSAGIDNESALSMPCDDHRAESATGPYTSLSQSPSPFKRVLGRGGKFTITPTASAAAVAASAAYGLDGCEDGFASDVPHAPLPVYGPAPRDTLRPLYTPVSSSPAPATQRPAFTGLATVAPAAIRRYKSSYCEETVKLWSVRRTLDPHHGCINSMSINDSGELLVTGSDDCTLGIYRTSDWARMASVRTEHRANIFAAAFFPSESSQVLSCALDGKVLLTDVNSMRGDTLWEAAAMATSLAVSHQWPSVAFVGYGHGQIVRVDRREWRRPGGGGAAELSGRPSSALVTGVNGLAVHERYPHTIAVATNTPYVFLHDTRMGTLAPFAALEISPGEGLRYGGAERPGGADSDGVGGVAFSHRGDYLAVNFRDDDVYLVPWSAALRDATADYAAHGYRDPAAWDMTAGISNQEFGDGGGGGGVELSTTRPLGYVSARLLTTAVATVPLISCRGCTRLVGRRNSMTMFKEVAFLEDDTVVCTGSDNGEVYFWRTCDGQLVHTTHGDDDVVNGVLYHPKVKELLCCGIDSTVKMIGPGEAVPGARPNRALRRHRRERGYFYSMRARARHGVEETEQEEEDEEERESSASSTAAGNAQGFHHVAAPPEGHSEEGGDFNESDAEEEGENGASTDARLSAMIRNMLHLANIADTGLVTPVSSSERDEEAESDYDSDGNNPPEVTDPAEHHEHEDEDDEDDYDHGMDGHAGDSSSFSSYCDTSSSSSICGSDHGRRRPRSLAERYPATWVLPASTAAAPAQQLPPAAAAPPSSRRGAAAPPPLSDACPVPRREPPVMPVSGAMSVRVSTTTRCTLAVSAAVNCLPSRYPMQDLLTIQESFWRMQSRLPRELQVANVLVQDMRDSDSSDDDEEEEEVDGDEDEEDWESAPEDDADTDGEVDLPWDAAAPDEYEGNLRAWAHDVMRDSAAVPQEVLRTLLPNMFGVMDFDLDSAEDSGGGDDGAAHGSADGSASSTPTDDHAGRDVLWLLGMPGGDAASDSEAQSDSVRSNSSGSGSGTAKSSAAAELASGEGISRGEVAMRRRAARLAAQHCLVRLPRLRLQLLATTDRATAAYCAAMEHKITARAKALLMALAAAEAAAPRGEGHVVSVRSPEYIAFTRLEAELGEFLSGLPPPFGPTDPARASVITVDPHLLQRPDERQQAQLDGALPRPPLLPAEVADSWEIAAGDINAKFRAADSTGAGLGATARHRYDYAVTRMAVRRLQRITRLVCDEHRWWDPVTDTLAPVIDLRPGRALRARATFSLRVDELLPVYALSMRHPVGSGLNVPLPSDQVSAVAAADASDVAGAAARESMLIYADGLPGARLRAEKMCQFLLPFTVAAYQIYMDAGRRDEYYRDLFIALYCGAARSLAAGVWDGSDRGCIDTLDTLFELAHLDGAVFDPRAELGVVTPDEFADVTSPVAPEALAAVTLPAEANSRKRGRHERHTPLLGVPASGSVLAPPLSPADDHPTDVSETAAGIPFQEGWWRCVPDVLSGAAVPPSRWFPRLFLTVDLRYTVTIDRFCEACGGDSAVIFERWTALFLAATAADLVAAERLVDGAPLHGMLVPAGQHRLLLRALANCLLAIRYVCAATVFSHSDPHPDVRLTSVLHDILPVLRERVFCIRHYPECGALRARYGRALPDILTFFEEFEASVPKGSDMFV